MTVKNDYFLSYLYTSFKTHSLSRRLPAYVKEQSRGLTEFPNTIWGKSVQRFLSYDRTNNALNDVLNWLFVLIRKEILSEYSIAGGSTDIPSRTWRLEQVSLEDDIAGGSRDIPSRTRRLEDLFLEDNIPGPRWDGTSLFKLKQTVSVNEISQQYSLYTFIRGEIKKIFLFSIWLSDLQIYAAETLFPNKIAAISFLLLLWERLKEYHCELYM